MTDKIAVREPTDMQSTQNLLSLALERGAAPETLERLMSLHERWQANQAKQEFVRAMADFKSTCPSVLPKDGKVDFQSSKGRTHYTHATLGAIVERITPHLSAQGLSIAWSTQQAQGSVTVTCRVTHAAGHSEEVALVGPPDDSGNKNRIQQVGSSVTYLQRYTLLAALGLATADQDDDGQGYGAKTPPRAAEGPRTRSQEPPAEPKTPELELKARVATCITKFAGIGVLEDDLERYTGSVAGEWTTDTLADLLAQYKYIAPLKGPERVSAITAVFGVPRDALDGGE